MAEQFHFYRRYCSCVQRDMHKNKFRRIVGESKAIGNNVNVDPYEKEMNYCMFIQMNTM